MFFTQLSINHIHTILVLLRLRLRLRDALLVQPSKLKSPLCYLKLIWRIVELYGTPNFKLIKLSL